jgi:hypothetical protein
MFAYIELFYGLFGNNLHIYPDATDANDTTDTINITDTKYSINQETTISVRKSIMEVL